jgi:hypothetical protein
MQSLLLALSPILRGFLRESSNIYLLETTGRGKKLLVGNVQNCRAISPGILQAVELFLDQLLLL